MGRRIDRARTSVITGLLAAMLLTACSGAGQDSASAGAGSATSAAAGSEAASAADAAPDGGAAAAPVAAVDRQVITTADVSMTVDDPRAAVARVVAVVEARGGRVDERSEQAAPEGEDASGASASLTVRVPAGEVTGVLAELEVVGEVDAVSLTASDVTAQARDLDARTSALRASTTRLEGLIADAVTTADVIAAEQALSDRQGALESLVAERTALGEQIDLSALRVQLLGDGAVPVPGPDGFLDGLGVGWSALLGAAGTALLVAGVLLPWAALALVLGAVAIAVRRLRRRRPPSGPPRPSGVGAPAA